jgi:hypothetical protein
LKEEIERDIEEAHNSVKIVIIDIWDQTNGVGSSFVALNNQKGANWKGCV